MNFYAHSVAGCPEADWELLAQHLAEVAGLARVGGERFRAGDLAALAGLVHDLGKYGPDFQARLRDPARRPDHSTAGALWAFQNLPPKWGRLLAHVVAGHHAGMKDDLLGSGGRIESKTALLAPVERAARNDGLELPQGVAGPAGMRCPTREVGSHLAFLSRMIFSCLIDADRAAATRFDARMRGEQAGAVEHPSIEALEAALRAGMVRDAAEPGSLNALRNDVLRAALAAADKDQGISPLTVPTGGGKTLTSLAFALAHARAKGLDRVIVDPVHLHQRADGAGVSRRAERAGRRGAGASQRFRDDR